MFKTPLAAALLAATVAAPFAAQAADEFMGHRAGDFIIRGGFATVAPNDDSGNVKLDGNKVSGTKATVDSDTQLGLTFKKRRLEEGTHTVDSYDEYKERVGGGGFYRVFLDVTNPEVEKRLQDETRSTIRCIPFDAPEEEGPCIITGAPCRNRVIAAQSY